MPTRGRTSRTPPLRPELNGRCATPLWSSTREDSNRGREGPARRCGRDDRGDRRRGRRDGPRAGAQARYSAPRPPAARRGPSARSRSAQRARRGAVRNAGSRQDPRTDAPRCRASAATIRGPPVGSARPPRPCPAPWVVGTPARSMASSPSALTDAPASPSSTGAIATGTVPTSASSTCPMRPGPSSAIGRSTRASSRCASSSSAESRYEQLTVTSAGSSARPGIVSVCSAVAPPSMRLVSVERVRRRSPESPRAMSWHFARPAFVPWFVTA